MGGLQKREKQSGGYRREGKEEKGTGAETDLVTLVDL
jgi:hypothetical protein